MLRSWMLQDLGTNAKQIQKKSLKNTFKKWGSRDELKIEKNLVSFNKKLVVIL